MFKNPFSFDGRIRRLEYGLSYIIYIFFYVIVTLIWEELESGEVFFFLAFAIMIWFLLAQGAKRCHDLGSSGFFQFIPFYGLLMIFQEGEKSDNKYGTNPKIELGISELPHSPFTPTSPKVNLGNTFLKLSTPILSNLLIAAILIEYLPFPDFKVGLIVLFSVIPGYFLALLINYQSFPFHMNKKELFAERILFSSVFYVCLRIYNFFFRGTELESETIFFELLLVFVLLGLTYIPFILFKSFSKKPSLPL